MRASEKMARRVVLVQNLARVDYDLKLALGMPPNRGMVAARKLLNTRRIVCDEMVAVGYQPWPVPVDINESKAI